jgi:hypothetical protein
MPRNSKQSIVKASTPAPAVTRNHHTVEVERPGFFSNMWQGFGLGTGQILARNVFGSDPVVKHVHESAPASVPVATQDVKLPKEFVQCMKDNNDKDLCKQFL